MRKVLTIILVLVLVLGQLPAFAAPTFTNGNVLEGEIDTNSQPPGDEVCEFCDPPEECACEASVDEPCAFCDPPLECTCEPHADEPCALCDQLEECTCEVLNEQFCEYCEYTKEECFCFELCEECEEYMKDCECVIDFMRLEVDPNTMPDDDILPVEFIVTPGEPKDVVIPGSIENEGEVWTGKSVEYLTRWIDDPDDDSDDPVQIEVPSGVAIVTIYLWGRGFDKNGHNNNLLGGERELRISAYLGEFTLWEYRDETEPEPWIWPSYPQDPRVNLGAPEGHSTHVSIYWEHNPVGNVLYFSVPQVFFTNTEDPLKITYVLYLYDRLKAEENWRLGIPYMTDPTQVVLQFDPDFDNPHYGTTVVQTENAFYFTGASWNSGNGPGGLNGVTLNDIELGTAANPLQLRFDKNSNTRGRIEQNGTVENYPFRGAGESNPGWNTGISLAPSTHPLAVANNPTNNPQGLWWFLEWTNNACDGWTTNAEGTRIECWRPDPNRPGEMIRCNYFHYTIYVENFKIPIGDDLFRTVSLEYDFRLSNTGGSGILEIIGLKTVTSETYFERDFSGDMDNLFDFERDANGNLILTHTSDATVSILLNDAWESPTADLTITKDLIGGWYESDWHFNEDTNFTIYIEALLDAYATQYLVFEVTSELGANLRTYNLVGFNNTRTVGERNADGEHLQGTLTSYIDFSKNTSARVTGLPIYARADFVDDDENGSGSWVPADPIVYRVTESLVQIFGAESAPLAEKLLSVTYGSCELLNEYPAGEVKQFSFRETTGEITVSVSNEFAHGIGFLSVQKAPLGFHWNWDVNNETDFYVRVWDNTEENWLMFDPLPLSNVQDVEGGAASGFANLTGTFFGGSFWTMGNHQLGLTGDYSAMLSAGRTPVLEVPISFVRSAVFSNLWTWGSYRVYEVRRTGTYMPQESTCQNGGGIWGNGNLCLTGCQPCADDRVWTTFWDNPLLDTDPIYDRANPAIWADVGTGTNWIEANWTGTPVFAFEAFEDSIYDRDFRIVSMEGNPRWEIVREIYYNIDDPRHSVAQRAWWDAIDWDWGAQYPVNNWPLKVRDPLNIRNNEPDPLNTMAFNQMIDVLLQNRFGHQSATIDLHKDVIGDHDLWGVDGETIFYARINAPEAILQGGDDSSGRYIVFMPVDDSFEGACVDHRNYRAVGTVEVDEFGRPIVAAPGLGINTFESFCTYLANNWFHPAISPAGVSPLTTVAQMNENNKPTRLLHVPTQPFTGLLGGTLGAHEPWIIEEVFPDPDYNEGQLLAWVSADERRNAPDGWLGWGIFVERWDPDLTGELVPHEMSEVDGSFIIDNHDDHLQATITNTFGLSVTINKELSGDWSKFDIEYTQEFEFQITSNLDSHNVLAFKIDNETGIYRAVAFVDDSVTILPPNTGQFTIINEGVDGSAWDDGWTIIISTSAADAPLVLKGIPRGFGNTDVIVYTIEEIGFENDGFLGPHIEVDGDEDETFTISEVAPTFITVTNVFETVRADVLTIEKELVGYWTDWGMRDITRFRARIYWDDDEDYVVVFEREENYTYHAVGVVETPTTRNPITIFTDFNGLQVNAEDLDFPVTDIITFTNISSAAVSDLPPTPEWGVDRNYRIQESFLIRGVLYPLVVGRLPGSESIVYEINIGGTLEFEEIDNREFQLEENETAQIQITNIFEVRYGLIAIHKELELVEGEWTWTAGHADEDTTFWVTVDMVGEEAPTSPLEFFAYDDGDPNFRKFVWADTDNEFYDEFIVAAIAAGAARITVIPFDGADNPTVLVGLPTSETEYTLQEVRENGDPLGDEAEEGFSSEYIMDIEPTEWDYNWVAVLTNTFLPLFSVTYIDSEKGELDVEWFWPGQTVNILHYNQFALTRDGHDFSHWTSDDPELLGQWSPGQSFEMPSVNVELVAQWTATEPPPGGNGTPQPDPTPQAPPPQQTEDETEPDEENGFFVDEHIWFIRGYQDGTIRPDNNITRAEVAMVFFRLLRPELREVMIPPSPFPDALPTDWYGDAVSLLAHHGIILGYEDGTFRPNSRISRREFAAMMTRFDELVETDNNPFLDVHAGDWAHSYILSVTARGWFVGYNNEFRPGEYLTRAELVTAVNRMLNRSILLEDIPDDVLVFPDLDRSHWGFAALMEATHTHEFERLPDGIDERWIRITDNGLDAPFNR
jgi:hypothetical protein